MLREQIKVCYCGSIIVLVTCHQGAYAKVTEETDAFREKLHVLLDRAMDRVMATLEYCGKLRGTLRLMMLLTISEKRVEVAQEGLQKHLSAANLSIAAARQQCTRRIV